MADATRVDFAESTKSWQNEKLQPFPNRYFLKSSNSIKLSTRSANSTCSALSAPQTPIWKSGQPSLTLQSAPCAKPDLASTQQQRARLAAPSCLLTRWTLRSLAPARAAASPDTDPSSLAAPWPAPAGSGGGGGGAAPIGGGGTGGGGGGGGPPDEAGITEAPLGWPGGRAGPERQRRWVITKNHPIQFAHHAAFPVLGLQPDSTSNQCKEVSHTRRVGKSGCINGQSALAVPWLGKHQWLLEYDCVLLQDPVSNNKLSPSQHVLYSMPKSKHGQHSLSGTFHLLLLQPSTCGLQTASGSNTDFCWHQPSSRSMGYRCMPPSVLWHRSVSLYSVSQQNAE